MQWVSSPALNRVCVHFLAVVMPGRIDRVGVFIDRIGVFTYRVGVSTTLKVFSHQHSRQVYDKYSRQGPL